MVRGVFGELLLALMLGSAGCQTCEVVEAELRYQTERADGLEHALETKEAEVHALQCTIDSLKPPAGQRADIPTPADTALQTANVTRVALGPLTGGYDDDHDGKDEGVQLVVVPQDGAGDAVKCPGRATIELMEIAATGEGRSLGVWTFNEADLFKTWRTSMLAQGYQLILRWRTLPSSGLIRARVVFATTDGRAFECQKEFRVSLTPHSTTAAPLPAKPAAKESVRPTERVPPVPAPAKDSARDPQARAPMPLLRSEMPAAATERKQSWFTLTSLFSPAARLPEKAAKEPPSTAPTPRANANDARSAAGGPWYASSLAQRPFSSTSARRSVQPLPAPIRPDPSTMPVPQPVEYVAEDVTKSIVPPPPAVVTAAPEGNDTILLPLPAPEPKLDSKPVRAVRQDAPAAAEMETIVLPPALP